MSTPNTSIEDRDNGYYQECHHLCLGDKDQREVTGEKIVTLIWENHESMYMIKSLDHILCLKQQLY